MRSSNATYAARPLEDPQRPSPVCVALGRLLLRAWYTHVASKTVSWQSWGDVKASFARASIVGDCVVFNIGGNKYRLVSRIRYATQKVFVLKVMTHSEYDEERWKDECGCFEPAPPPKKSAPAKRSARER